MMLLTVHNLAEKYGVLPSEALERGTTFDLHILDLAAKYSQYQHEQAERERQGQGQLPPPPKLTQAQMQAMIDRVRNKRSDDGVKTN
jgi:hypothetical protein